MPFQILHMPKTARKTYLASLPCLDDEPMDLAKPPPFRIKNLCVPRLRKCPFDLGTVDWQRTRLIGKGADGYVYRVYFGEQGPFALKMFWKPGLKAAPGEAYSAAHRECQVAALLQVLRASVDQAVAAGGTPDPPAGPVDPPYVLAEPSGHADNLGNLLAFSEQARRNPAKFGHPVEAAPRRLVPVTTMPRFAQCHGWLRYAPSTLRAQMPARLRPGAYAVNRKITRRCAWDCSDETYYAIVYEYIASDPGGAPQPPPPPPCPVTQLPPMPPRPPPATKKRPTKAEREAAEAAKAAEREYGAALARARERNRDWGEAMERYAARIPDAHRERATAVLDFLYSAGLELVNTPLARNRKSGVLVDHAELAGPYMAGWFDRKSRGFANMYLALGLREETEEEVKAREKREADAWAFYHPTDS